MLVFAVSVAVSLLSRDYQTGRDGGEGRDVNMAARSMLRSVWSSFSGLKVVNVKVQQMINVPQLSALTIQTRGIRQGEFHLHVKMEVRRARVS